jgi:hypothetical protein
VTPLPSAGSGQVSTGAALPDVLPPTLPGRAEGETPGYAAGQSNSTSASATQPLQNQNPEACSDDGLPGRHAMSEQCPPGCRWEITAVTFGKDIHGDWIDRRCAASLVACLPHVPIGWFPHEGGLAHRPGGLIQRQGDTLDAAHVVGIIETAWATADGVNARVHLATEAAWLARGLLRMERDRVLHVMGLSIDATADVWTWLHPHAGARRVLSIGRVRSVDFVTSAAGAKCYVRRRLPCPHPPTEALTR